MIRSYRGLTRHTITADCLDLVDDLADLFSFYLIVLGQRSFYSIGNQLREKSTPVLFCVHSLDILDFKRQVSAVRETICQ